MSGSPPPIVIPGSRLQALIVATIAIAAAIVIAPRSAGAALAVAAALGVSALFIATMRVELHPDRVVARRLVGSFECDAALADARFGHRYLTVRPPSARSFRIEVPVEIRPEVRDWVDTHS